MKTKTKTKNKNKTKMLCTTCMFFFAYSVKIYAEKLLLFAGYVH